MLRYVFKNHGQTIGISTDLQGATLPASLGPWTATQLRHVSLDKRRTKLRPPKEHDDKVLDDMLKGLDNDLFSDLMKFLQEQDYEISFVKAPFD